MLGDWSSLETPLPWRQKRDGVDGSGMTKGQGERSAVVECSVAAGVRRLCGHAFPPLGTSTGVPIPPPRTCREVENRLPVPAAYSARWNESHQSSSSLLINRRRGGGIIVWHLAYPARACAGRANPRGASSSARYAATAATSPHRSLATRSWLPLPAGAPGWLRHRSSYKPPRPQLGFAIWAIVRAASGLSRGRIRLKPYTKWDKMGQKWEWAVQFDGSSKGAENTTGPARWAHFQCVCRTCL